jgi:hypothetical protein
VVRSAQSRGRHNRRCSEVGTTPNLERSRRQARSARRTDDARSTRRWRAPSSEPAPPVLGHRASPRREVEPPPGTASLPVQQSTTEQQADLLTRRQGLLLDGAAASPISFKVAGQSPCFGAIIKSGLRSRRAPRFEHGRRPPARHCGEQTRERNDNAKGSQVPGLRQVHASAVHHQPVEVLRRELPDRRQEGSGLLKSATASKNSGPNEQVQPLLRLGTVSKPFDLSVRRSHAPGSHKSTSETMEYHPTQVDR